MKSLLISLLIVSTSNLFAKESLLIEDKIIVEETSEFVFTAKASWNTSESFDQLERDGVTMNAFEKAYDKCLDRYTLCSLRNHEITSTTTRSGRRHLEIKAVVEALDRFRRRGLLTRAQESFKGDESWNSNNRFDALEHLGIRFGAFVEALSSCYEAGNQFCVFVNARIVKSNDYTSGRYYSSSESRVRGFKLR